MTLVQDTLASFKSRLSEIEREIAPLVTEADELRAVIGQLEGAIPAKPRARRGSSGGARKRASGSKRQPRGALRDAVKAGAAQHPGMTSGELAKELGLPRNSVATALSKLRASGDLPPRAKADAS